MSYQALLFCPDEKTARVVTQVLTELDFTVEPCTEPFAAVKKLMAQHFDAIVVDSENEQNATLLFKSARNSSTNHSSLAVAVVEGQAGVAKAFRIGANLVLTKPINVEQSKGTLRVARGLLRKGAEASKTTAASGPVQKSAHVPPPHSVPEIPAPPASSLFELEKEPEPQPEPAEAALLESMPDPVGKTTSAKDFPWQPVAKPVSEPMASAIRRAAEAAGKRSEIESPADRKPASANLSAASPAKLRESQTPAWGPAAASAPAPAKETPRPAKPTLEPKPEVIAAAPAPKPSDFAAAPLSVKTPVSQAPIAAPSFSTLDAKTEETGSQSGMKKFTIAVAAALLLAACGYFAWTRMHLGRPAPAGQTPVAAQAPAPQPQIATAAPAVPAPAAVQQPQTNGAGSAQVVPPSEPVSSKPSPNRESEAANLATAKPAPAMKTPEPVVVRNEAPAPAVHKPAPEEPVQPPALAMAGEPGSQDLSGIVTSTPVSVPQPAQMLRVSQGVSQGLLLKKVQPVYPSQALQMRQQGAVQLQAIISKEGNIRNLKVLSGAGILARAAVDAVRQWKYRPYYLNGEPVEIQTQITVNFRLP